MSYIPPHQREGASDVNAEDVTMPPPQDATTGGPEDGAKERVVSTTCVYVEYLPLNVTVEEVAHEFGQCGELAKDDAGKPRIKLYRHRDGTLKGDGLVNYELPEGAEGALNDMDGRPLRMYGDDDDEEAMVVTMAFFENKEKKQRKQPESPREANKQQRDKQQQQPREWRDPSGSPLPQRAYEPPEDDSYDEPKPRGKPKAVVDDDGWETVGTVRGDGAVGGQPAVDVAAAPKPASLDRVLKSKVKHSTSVISFDGSVQKGWGDDDSSDDDDLPEEEAEPEVVAVEDIEGIDDMTGDLGDDTDSEDEEVKQKRRIEALAAKEQQQSKPKAKKKQGKLSKKELKELKQKQDEEFERLLNQAVEEVNIAKSGSETPETGESGGESAAESVTPPDATEPVVLDKAQLAKAAKNKKRKEAAKKKKEEEEKERQAAKDREQSAKEAAGSKEASTNKEASVKKVLTPAEVLAQKKEKRAKKEAKLAKERAKINAEKAATQKRAKAAHAKSAANFEQNKREKFHFSSENSSGCDAG